MALVVLELGPSARVATGTRVLSASQWQAVSGAAELREQVEQALARSRADADEAMQRKLAARTEQIEREAQQRLLQKSLELQREYGRALGDLRSRFVETVSTCLQALLMPPPPELYARVQESAGALVGEGAVLSLHVAAADSAAAYQALAASPGEVRIVADPDLEAGQCFLETRFGRIQAGLPTQLEALREALTRWWSGEGGAVSDHLPPQEA
jgi:flagellar biosynthesis/type III secretory pathway protein FliH